MAIALDQFESIHNDAEMLTLCSAAISQIAAEIVDVADVTPQGEKRLEFAENALLNPEDGQKQVWRFMVNTNLQANLDDLLRSEGDPTTPDDDTIVNNARKAIDNLYPVGT